MAEPLVLDASCAISLLLPGPEQTRYETLFREWADAGYELCAPALWIYEVTSALTKAVRLGGLSAAEGARILTQALNLGIQLVAADELQARAAYTWTVRLGRAAAYDGFYLALAEALGCDLWTADERLRNAVSLPWVRAPEWRT